LPKKPGFSASSPPTDDAYIGVDGEPRRITRLEQAADDAPEYAAHAKAPNTLKAYRIDWVNFPNGARCKVGMPFGSNPDSCPVRSLRAWLDVAATARGPIFRPVDCHANISDTRLTDKSVALIVKRCAKAAGLGWKDTRAPRCDRGWPPRRPWRTCRSRRSWPRSGTSSAHGPPLHSRRFFVQE
jgi:hypothetical protein